MHYSITEILSEIIKKNDIFYNYTKVGYNKLQEIYWNPSTLSLILTLRLPTFPPGTPTADLSCKFMLVQILTENSWDYTKEKRNTNKS